jgi:diguanylate cyclase (GGDEF)-like protein
MKTITSALTRLEKGQATPQDLELVMNFVRRAVPFTSSLPDDAPYPQNKQDLYSLVNAITEIASSLEINRIASLTAAKISALIPVGSCAVFIWETLDEKLQLQSEWTSSQWQTPFHWPPSISSNSFPLIREASHTNHPVQGFVLEEQTGLEMHSIFQQAGVSNAVAIPIINRKQPMGVIVLLFHRSAEPIDDDQMSTLQLFANQAGVSMENARLYQDARQHNRELEAVHQASLTLTASLDLLNVLNAIIQSTLSLIKDAQDAHIYLYEDGVLHFGAAIWSDGRSETPYSIPRPNGLTYSVARGGEPLQVKEMDNHPLFQDTPSEWRGSIIGLPLKIGTRVVGVMNVARLLAGGFNESEQRVLRLLADQAAMAIENARLHNIIKQQALTDALTGLANRRFFDQRMEEEIRRSVRYRHSFALMIADLDNFKEINDTFGHPAGDSILQQVANLLHRTLNDTDFLARYGGDEFALILPESDLSGVESLARRLKRVFAENSFHLPGGQKRKLSTSVGYALFPEDAANAGYLLAAADQMLYRNKHH